eukprot:244926_1
MGCIGSKAVAAITSKESTVPTKAVSVRRYENEDKSVSTNSTNRATNLSRSRMHRVSQDRMSDSIMSLGVVHLSDNSHHSEDGYRYKMECTVTLPLCEHFDKKELSRKVDKHFIKHAHITTEQENEVINCIMTFHTSLGFSHLSSGGGSMHQIAAQFKHTHMKGSPLSPQMIEAILSRLAMKQRLEFDTWPVTISYTDDSVVYEKGVREFCFAWE